MIIVVFLAAFLTVFLIGWIVYALTHPVMAGQGTVIFLCKAAGVITVVTGIGVWIGQNLLSAVPPFLFAAALFFCANRLELRWRRW